MKRFTYRLLLTLGILFLAGNLFLNPHVYSESYINIKDTCLLGLGLPVGVIVMVQGKSILIRPKIEHSCWTEKGTSLFIDDVISTQDTGRVRFNFNDGSHVTLGFRTELEITQSLYDTARKERSLFFNLHSGKARFVIKRLDDFKEKTAKIMTKTTLVVVKGSDFVIEANDESTKITSFEDTYLEVVNLAYLDMEPVIIMDFRSAIFKKDSLISQVEEISKKEAKKIIQDFSFHEPESKTDKIQKEKIKDIKKWESVNAGQTAKKKEEADEVDKVIFVSEDDLVEPEALEKPEEPETLELIIQEEDPINIPSRISNEEVDEHIVLPEFPRPPFN